MKRMLFVVGALALTAGLLLAQKEPQGDEFKAWMKNIQAQMQAFNQAYTAMDKQKASAAIDALKADFQKVQAHWEKKSKADAINWSKEFVGYMDQAQAKMKRDDIAYALNLVQLGQKNCKACHDLYRPAPASKNQN